MAILGMTPDVAKVEVFETTEACGQEDAAHEQEECRQKLEIYFLQNWKYISHKQEECRQKLERSK